METTLVCFRKRPRHFFITQEGYIYILLGLLVSLLVFKVYGWKTAFPFSLLTLYFMTFFRNPKRKIPAAEGFLAPADGKVLEVTECEEPYYLKAKAKKISIFMSPFNCHLNRSPISAKVVGCHYRKGLFKAAFKPKAVEHNEHHAVLLEDERSHRWLVIQIAGWLARRIVSYVKEGDFLMKGERFGLIQFGSRTELYCPHHTEVFIKPGQKVFAGETVLGRLS